MRSEAQAAEARLEAAPCMAKCDGALCSLPMPTYQGTPELSVEQPAFISRGFCGPGTWAQLHWLLCSGSLEGSLGTWVSSEGSSRARPTSELTQLPWAGVSSSLAFGCRQVPGGWESLGATSQAASPASWCGELATARRKETLWLIWPFCLISQLQVGEGPFSFQ